MPTMIGIRIALCSHWMSVGDRTVRRQEADLSVLGARRAATRGPGPPPQRRPTPRHPPETESMLLPSPASLPHAPATTPFRASHRPSPRQRVLDWVRHYTARRMIDNRLSKIANRFDGAACFCPRPRVRNGPWANSASALPRSSAAEEGPAGAGRMADGRNLQRRPVRRFFRLAEGARRALYRNGRRAANVVA